MEKMNFSVDINASKKVSSVLWKDDSYKEWTSPSAEGSYARPWKK